MGSESFVVMDHGHGHRTEIPNIVEDSNLDPYAMRLYLKLKRIAGDAGACWMSVAKLAACCGMSERCVRLKMKELMMPREWLEGRSLISSMPRFKSDGSRDTSLIEINDIWDINAKVCRQRNIERKSRGGTAPRAGGVLHHVQGGTAPRADKEEPIEEEPIEEFISSPPDVGGGEIRQISEELWNAVRNNAPKAKTPDLVKWDREIRLMKERDGWSIEDIRSAIEFATTDDFWKTNILSASKLRAKMNELILKSELKKAQNDRSENIFLARSAQQAGVKVFIGANKVSCCTTGREISLSLSHPSFRALFNDTFGGTDE